MAPSHSILIVDDSLTQLAVLQDFLTAAGYAVTTAQNGMQAIASVHHEPPDLILSDILMPELNGYHLCRLLKNDPLTQAIPVILLSNLAEQHDRFWGEKAGADHFIEKSAHLEGLLDIIARFLKDKPKRTLIPAGGLVEIDGKDIRNQITGILDRLLYESTISNEILKLTSLAHDSSLLAKELFQFLSIICRYSAAGLLLRESSGKYLLCLNILEPVSTGFIDHAKKEMLNQAGLEENDNAAKFRFVLFEQDHAVNGRMPSNFQVIKTLPIYEGTELLAAITLFESGKRRLTDGMRQALDIIADRFLFVARYLKRIREIEDVKADLVSMLVHDMRSPLTGISGFTDVLAEGILGQVSKEQGEALKNIQEGCGRLLQLIDDILDYSKLEARKMHVVLEPLQIAPLVGQIVFSFATLLKEQQLRVETEWPAEFPMVLADEKQLTRVLTNLLSNAVKFTPAGGTIHIGVTAPMEIHGRPFLGITVTDTGCGIPKEQQDILFNRYEQLPTATVYRKGTGLGLAICKEIVNLHGGRIWVESPATADGGSRFVFTLPLARPAAE